MRGWWRLAVGATAVTLAAGQPARAQPAPAVREARRAQRTFEGERRRHLRLWTGRAGRCEVLLGPLCYWHNNADEPPPPERPAVADARARLLDVLAGAAAAAPSDDWIVGQRVRYLVEAGRPDSALAAARGCAGTPAWCTALRGLALHAAGDALAALAAFDSAAALRPREARCRWRDVSAAWLDRRAGAAWRRSGCDTPARAAVERRFWRLVQPLWSAPGNDLRAEWEARRATAQLLADSENPQGMPWTSAFEQLGLRFGWPTAWSRSEALGPASAQPGIGVTGHEPKPSYSFLPDDGPLAAALAGAPGDDLSWAPLAPDARSRYAPPWARGGLLLLDDVQAVQLARFRRGDTAMVVGSWTLERDTTGFASDGRWRGGGLRAALVALDDSLAEVGRAEASAAPLRGALAVRTVPTSGAGPPRLVGLELVDTAPRRAAWARRAVAPLPAGAQLSDLLLVAPGTAADPRLEVVLAAARGTPAVRAGSSVGLYWERYRPATVQGDDSVAVTATRLTRTLGERVRAAVGMDVVRRPVAVRYVDPTPPGAPPGRSITVAWPDVPPGDYRLEVVVTGADGRAAATATTVRLERP